MELLPVGSWETCKQGQDIAILAVGPMVYTALSAADKLNDENLKVEVINCRFIKPMDTACLVNIKNKFKNIISIEEGTINGGFGDGVASWLLENGYSGSLKRLGLPDSYVEHGTRDQILKQLGLDVEGLVLSIEQMVKQKTN